MRQSVKIKNRRVYFPYSIDPKIKISESLFQDLSKGDKIAINNCLERFGNKVWALAANFLPAEYLEKVTREIFIDIWKCADKFDHAKFSEEDFIKMIAVSRILKFKKRFNSN